MNKNIKRIIAITLAISTISAVSPATNLNLLSVDAYALTDDSIYLSKLSINGESISLSDSKTTYTYNVNSDVEEVPIKAVPEDDSYTVTIDGTTVDDTDNYKNTVSLDKGKNTIEVEITDDNSDDRVYILNITRASSSSTSTSTISTAKTNQWVEINGKWQYNDSIGNPIKSTWFYDRSNGKSYYLNSDGIRQTGWINDTNGKYYYLNLDGSMAVNTTIDGYKLGADGAWIKDNVVNTTNTTIGEWRQDSTGWFYKEDNSYAKGWKHIDSNWYYFYSDGYMAHDTKIGDYYLNSSGAWSNNVPASFSQGVRIGMTKEQVLVSSWGKPTDINKTTTKYGTQEQWVYRYGNYNSDYLYFNNGILTSIQN